nr:MAG: hypothetical protein [Bacteriophage sp.]
MPERKIGGESLMKRAMRWVLKNGIPIALGIVATASAVNYANEWRGYTAYGSEWLVFPVTIFICRKATDFLMQIRRRQTKNVCGLYDVGM